MKTIFLLSSIFYILGLKIGHKIDVFKNYNPVEKITSKSTAVKEAAKSVYFNDEDKLKNTPDSVKCATEINKNEVKKDHF